MPLLLRSQIPITFCALDRQNVNQKLTDAAVDKADKNMLLDKMFGEDGIINADDTVCFEEKCEEYESLSQSVSEPFLRIFRKG